MGFKTSRSILTLKLPNTNATKFKPDKALLKLAKNAIWECNKRHSLPPSSIKKHDVILLPLAVYIYLYIFCCKHDECSDTKQGIYIFHYARRLKIHAIPTNIFKI